MYPTYLIHYTKLKTRLKPSLSSWQALGIQPTVIETCDGNKLYDYESCQNLWDVRVRDIADILLDNCGLNKLQLGSVNNFELPIWMQSRQLKKGEISVLLKHFTALLFIANGADNYGIISEDDVRYIPRMKNQFLYDINEFNTLKGDYLDFAGGGNLNLKTPITRNSNLAKLQICKTRTNAGYIVSKNLAKVIVDQFFPLVFPIDWHLQWIFCQLNNKNFSCYWSIQETMLHGSEHGAVKSWRDD